MRSAINSYRALSRPPLNSIVMKVFRQFNSIVSVQTYIGDKKIDCIRPTLIWPSVARLTATGAIFLFHYLGLLEYDQYRLDFFAIMTFCFLSGYLIKIDKKARHEWAIMRYFGIMVPYWLVIIPVMVVNEVIQYKTVSPAEYVVTLFGGNLFLENPLYVLAWYVTFVLILYAYIFAESFFRSYMVVICRLIGAVIFVFLFRKGFYFIAFFVGIFMSGRQRSESDIGGDRRIGDVSLWLFVAQRYCYSFFLVHGAVLLFFVKKTNVSEIVLFSVSFFLSAVLSVAVYMTSKLLHILATDKALKLTYNRKLWQNPYSDRLIWKSRFHNLSFKRTGCCGSCYNYYGWRCAVLLTTIF